MLTFVIVIIIAVVGALAWAALTGDAHNPNSNSPELQRERQLHASHGAINAAMVCPHCQQRGTVRTQQVSNKKGVSGGKAAAALLTGGVSMLATGLSRHESATRAHCDACDNAWEF